MGYDINLVLEIIEHLNDYQKISKFSMLNIFGISSTYLKFHYFTYIPNLYATRSFL